MLCREDSATECQCCSSRGRRWVAPLTTASCPLWLNQHASHGTKHQQFGIRSDEIDYKNCSSRRQPDSVWSPSRQLWLGNRRGLPGSGVVTDRDVWLYLWLTCRVTLDCRRQWSRFAELIRSWDILTRRSSLQLWVWLVLRSSQRSDLHWYVAPKSGGWKADGCLDELKVTRNTFTLWFAAFARRGMFSALLYEKTSSDFWTHLLTFISASRHEKPAHFTCCITGVSLWRAHVGFPGRLGLGCGVKQLQVPSRPRGVTSQGPSGRTAAGKPC